MRIRTHTNPFNYYHRMTPLKLESVFAGYNGPIDLEIGFGRGVFLRHYAQKFPERRIIGVDIRKNIVETVHQNCELDGLNNVHLIHGNGEIVAKDALGPASVARLFVFHPDPWFKKRHHKRRVINPSFLESVKRLLIEDGRVYVSTDVEVLWDAMQEELLANGFVCDNEDSFWEDDYLSHWTTFSQKDSRNIHYGTFRLGV